MTIKKLFERAAAVVLSLCLVGGVTGFEPICKDLHLRASASDYTEVTDNAMLFYVYNNHAEIARCDTETEGELIIPSRIEGIPVTYIRSGAFKNCSKISSIGIPKSVKRIDSYAFASCESLASINIPDGVTKIEGWTFDDCFSLTSIDIPDSVNLIGEHAFDDCEKLSSVSIPDSVTIIDEGAFIRCINLQSIVIPDSVTTIGGSAFCGCKSLEYVKLSESLLDISARTFLGCTSLTSITIPDSVSFIDAGNNDIDPFAFCSNLTSITLPAYLTSVSTFVECNNLKDIYYKGTEERWNKYIGKDKVGSDVTIHFGEVPENLFRLSYCNGKETKPTYNYFPMDLHNAVLNTNAISYNPELANMLCILSQSAYDNPTSWRSGCIVDNYRQMGYKRFRDFDLYDYDSTYYQADNCGYAIGYKDLEDGTREFLITVRGTAHELLDFDGEEWFSDFNMGFSQLEFLGDYPKYHHGFYVAAQRIWESLKKCNDGTIRTDKVRYVLTGHSRGAAVSNLVSRALIEAGVKKSDLYSYNFACPDVAIGNESHFLDSSLNSIFNLNCARDLVGQVPGALGTNLSKSKWRALLGDVEYWGKFGRTFFWDSDWDSSLPADALKLADYHPCDTNYIPYFSWEHPLSDFKTYDEMKAIQNNHLFFWSPAKLINESIHVVHTTIRPQPTYISAYAFDDTTVKITDKDGKVVGTVKDNSVSIESGYEDKIQANFIGDSVDIAIDADSGYQISVESEAPATIAVSQENAAYNSVNNGAVYTAQPGNTTIDIAPDTPAAETPVTDNSGKAIEPDKVWNLGDVNGDKSANIADAVLLQKWLLNKPDSDLTEWTAADIYEDGKLNVYDLTLLKQLITE